MNTKELTAAAEAVLFAAGEPLETARLASVLETDEKTLAEILDTYAKALDERGAGICLLRLDDKYQLCSRKEYADKIRTVLDLRRNTPLSPAAFEVLAVVAYNQPITKAFIEQVRGVDCSGVIATLCQRELIEEKGRLDLPGRPLIYGTTDTFLRCFCISSLDELPSLPQHDNEQAGKAMAEMMPENATDEVPQEEIKPENTALPLEQQ